MAGIEPVPTAAEAGVEPEQPPPECGLCPRLVQFRQDNRATYPGFFNAPVPSFGPPETARLLIVGLAPGLKGANRTGRPFTGDYAGDLLYPTLLTFGWARGDYGADPSDGLTLTACRITNAVRCVPPENKPVGAEIATCRRFLTAEVSALPALQAILCLGGVAHKSVVAALALRQAEWPFAHGAVHTPPERPLVVDSYHCSRYNTSTGRLTPAMFRAVFERLAEVLPHER